MKKIEELDDEQAVFTLYRLLEAKVGSVEINEDIVEAELRGSIASALKNPKAAEQLSARIANDEKAAGEAARLALVAIRDRDLLPDARAELDALLKKPPVSETLDFGASICGIALVSLLLTMRLGYTHKRTAATAKGSSETEVTVSVGSPKLVDLARTLWTSLKR